MTISIETMRKGHWPAVRDIYAEGIETRNATFETEPPGWEAWSAVHLEGCRIVALDAETVLGWGALSPVSGRCIYRGVAEVSVYVSAGHRGGGLGRRLLEELVRRSAGGVIADPRVVRRIIKQHCGMSGLVPHARCYPIARDTLLGLVNASELGLLPAEVPAEVILLIRMSFAASRRLP